MRWVLLLRNQVLTAVIAMTVLVPVLFSASIVNRVQQNVAYGALGLALLVVFLFRASARLSWREAGRLALAGPNLPILLYVAWNLWCVSRSIDPFLSRLQFVQLGCGLAIYAAVALQIRRREEIAAALGCAIAVGVAAVIAALVMDSEHRLSNLAGTFHDQQLFGAFLMLLIPVALGVGAGAQTPNTKLAARLAAALLTVALLLSSCRSSWLGALTGGAAFAALSVFFVLKPSALRQKKHELVIVPILTLALIGVFVGISGSWNTVLDRVASFQSVSATKQGDSLAARVKLWNVAKRVIAARPVTGWGPGAYAIAQLRFNPESRPADEIAITGPSLSESPHNTYIATLAEQGFVGLALYLLMIGTFLYTGVRALSGSRQPFRQYALIGCLAGVVGHLVDSIGNPAWLYPEVSMFLWLVLGMGMSLAGLAGNEDELEDAQPSRRSSRRSSGRSSSRPAPGMTPSTGHTE